MNDDLLFTERELRGTWNPRQAVLNVLGEKGLSEGEVNLYGPLFDTFRRQGPDEGLILPDVRRSSEWESLFYKCRPNRKQDGTIEYIDEETYYKGLTGLDHIGRDFVALIYYYQKFSEDLSQGLNIFLRRFFRGQISDLSSRGADNTLVYSEALFDVMTDYGFSFPTGDKSVLISDQPQGKHFSLEETPSFLSMIRTGSNLNRYIRLLSVILQDGGTGDDLRGLTPEKYGLSKKLRFFGDVETQTTSSFALKVALCREFGLYLTDRIDKLPSLREISEKKRIPYFDLLSVLVEYNPLTDDETDSFPFCDYLFKGDISERFLNIWEEELEKNLEESGSN